MPITVFEKSCVSSFERNRVETDKHSAFRLACGALNNGAQPVLAEDQKCVLTRPGDNMFRPDQSFDLVFTGPAEELCNIWIICRIFNGMMSDPQHPVHHEYRILSDEWATQHYMEFKDSLRPSLSEQSEHHAQLLPSPEGLRTLFQAPSLLLGQRIMVRAVLMLNDLCDELTLTKTLHYTLKDVYSLILESKRTGMTIADLINSRN